MRYVKGDFVLTGPDVLTMRFKAEDEQNRVGSNCFLGVPRFEILPPALVRPLKT